jgi:hypothetical protein
MTTYTGGYPEGQGARQRARAPDGVLLAIVIVSYNSRSLVEACLGSLADHPLTLGPTEVHIVDNCSSDGTADVVSAAFPSVIVHRLDRNLGFSVGNNVVLRDAGARYVLLLNPDTEARPGTLDHMVRLMEEDASVGMSGCRLVQPDGTFDHAAKRSFPTPAGALAHFAKVGRLPIAGARLAQYRAPEVDEFGIGRVDAVNGAFMLVRRQAMQDVGFLDESYWLYMEDLDWCYRFHQRGWGVVYDGSVEFVHVKGGSAGKHRRLRQNAAFHQGMVRFYKKFYAGPRPLVDVAVYTGILLKFVISVVGSAAARSRARIGA